MKLTRTVGCFVTTLLIAAGTASAQTWGRPQTPAVGACFYERPDFNGQYFCVRIAESTAQVPPGTNDRISSIRVFGSAEVIVYKDANFHGTSNRFDANVRDLREIGWNDRISSFSVGSRGYGRFGGNDWDGSMPRAGACFYEHPSFGGRYFCANLGASTPEVPSGTNDKISSIRLIGNASITVFQDARFGGRSARFDNDQRDLKRGGWDDLISSFRVTPLGFGDANRGSGGFGASNGLLVYADINYRGRNATLGESTPDVAARGMGGLISSIRVPPGERWQVCTEQNFRGRCQTITGDASDLRRGDWNDAIASVRRIR